MIGAVRNFVRNYVNNTKIKLNNKLSYFTNLVQTIIGFIFTLSAVAWCAAFLYGSFYFYYVPVVSQEKPVYFHFRVCENGLGMCSFPIANISLSRDGQNEVFKIGQSYKIVLDMDVPESDANRKLGMFMIEMRLYNRKGEVVQTSARATSLHYKSDLLRVLETLAFSPLFLFGYMQQKQFLHVELFPDFSDNAYNPSVGLVIEVQSMLVELYESKLKVFAQFSGIRYFLYYWPITSAVAGISVNFFVLGFIVLLSWYQFWSPWKQNGSYPVVRVNLPQNRKPESPKKNLKGKPKSPHIAETVGGAACNDVSEDSEDEETLLLSRHSPSKTDTGLRLRQSRPSDVS